jgi:glycogen operon protein
MAAEDWDNRMSRIVGAWIAQPGRGNQALLLLVNARDMDASFQLPPGNWMAELDSSASDGRSGWIREARTEYILPARAVVLLRDDSGG